MQCKFLVAFFAICLCSEIATGAEMKSTVRSTVIKDKWAIAEGMHNGKPLVIRFREGLKKDAPDLSSFPFLVKVSWTYKGGPSGMPNDAIGKAMRTFEERLSSAVEQNMSAVLVAAITNDNTCVWVYYASSIESFSERLHRMPQEAAPYPIQIEANEDPEWEFLFSEILAGMSDENP